MINVKIEAAGSHIYDLRIENDETGNSLTGHYNVDLSPSHLSGRVENFPRGKGILELVRRSLESLKGPTK